jgi:hypothetical protein
MSHKDNDDWPFSEFSDDDSTPKKKKPAVTAKSPEPVPDETNKRPNVFQHAVDWWFPPKRTPDPKPPVKKPVVDGADTMITVPDNVKRIRVQILDSDNDLKNEYVLTNWISVNPGDKFRIIMEK